MCRKILLLFFLLLSGCVKNFPSMNEDVQDLLEERLCLQNNDCLDDLLSCPLTLNTIVQIAFINNPDVQAIWEELGIAQADLMEASLLPNPSFDLDVRYPTTSGLKTNIEYLVVTSLVDLFLLPLRTKMASVAFEQTKLKVAEQLILLAIEARKSWVELVANTQKLNFARAIADLQNIQREIALKQDQVGNSGLLHFPPIGAAYWESEWDIARLQREHSHYRHELARLLGLQENHCFILPEALPVDFYPLPLCDFEAIALEERLDLKALRLEVMRLEKGLKLKDGWTYTTLQGGVAGERETDGANVIGFGLKGEIPLFNYGQAARRRLWSMLRQTCARIQAKEIQVLAEVRQAFEKLQISRETVSRYQTDYLPLQQAWVEYSEELYYAMSLGVDRLLESKQRQLIALQKYSEELRAYWLTCIELDQSLGGRSCY